MDVVTKDPLIDHQMELELLFSKNQLIPRLRSEFMNCKEADFQTYVTSNGIPLEFGMDVLIQMALHKRCTLPTLVGLLRHHFGDKALQLTADMLLRCCDADLMDWEPVTRMFVVRFTIDAEVQAQLDRFQFPLPMVVKPMKVEDNRHTGYIVGNGSIILKRNHHDDDVCLDHINRMNALPLTLNHEVVKMVKNQWKNLDKAKQGESAQDFDRRKKAFEKYDRCARDVIALLQKEGDQFYLTHKYCKRGRTYPVGYYVNTQGNSWCKATVEFFNKEIVA